LRNRVNNIIQNAKKKSADVKKKPTGGGPRKPPADTQFTYTEDTILELLGKRATGLEPGEYCEDAGSVAHTTKEEESNPDDPLPVGEFNCGVDGNVYIKEVGLDVNEIKNVNIQEAEALNICLEDILKYEIQKRDLMPHLSRVLQNQNKTGRNMRRTC
jgi:hypothetical protein